MTRILQAVRRALRMAGAEPDLTEDPRVSDLERALRRHGLHLSVTDSDESQLRLSAQWMLLRAEERAIKDGEGDYGMVARLARLVGRSQPRVTRAFQGQDLDEEARAALEEHLLDPAKHPLPPVGKSPGRPKGS